MAANRYGFEKRRKEKEKKKKQEEKRRKKQEKRAAKKAVKEDLPYPRPEDHPSEGIKNP